MADEIYSTGWTFPDPSTGVLALPQTAQDIQTIAEQQTLVWSTSDLSNWDTVGRTVDNYFPAGQLGILEFVIKPLPDWMNQIGLWVANTGLVNAIVGAAQGTAPEDTRTQGLTDLDNLLTSKYVKLWKPSAFVNGNLQIYFITGLAPFAIAAIVLAALVGVAILAWVLVSQISAYQVAQGAAAAYNAQKTTTTAAALQAISALPADKQPAALQALLDSQNANSPYPLSSNSTPTQDTNRWIIVAAAAGVVILGGTAIYMALGKKRR